MKYKFFRNSPEGLHCVQACLQTLFHYFGMKVMTLDQLDKITGHSPDKFTWMTSILLWLSARKKFSIVHVENLDYHEFALHGREYLKKIWTKEVFALQDQYSDLEKEHQDASKLTNDPSIILLNSRLAARDIEKVWNLHKKITRQNKMFRSVFLLSVNPHVLYGRSNDYGSHLVVITNFKNNKVQICDPDRNILWYDMDILDRAISANNKPDFSLTVITALR